MSMKSSAPLLAYLTLFSGGMPMSNRIKRVDNSRKVPPMPNGMKKWDIDGVIVFAATKKAAIKKANKK